MKLTVFIIWATLFSSAFSHAQQFCTEIFTPKSAYELAQELQVHRGQTLYAGRTEPYANKAFGVDQEILRSFEKEGADYAEIYTWFPNIKYDGIDTLRMRFQLEELKPNNPKTKTMLHSWLMSQTPQFEIPGWAQADAHTRLNIWLRDKNPMAVFKPSDYNFLFETEILTYDAISRSENTPDNVVMSSDWTSWEVRLGQGIADRTNFFQMREKVQDYLEGKVGHQHLLHFWPLDAAKRKEISGQYIETLDSSSWFLFWRQMKRDPDKLSEPVLFHKYLGIYPRQSLNRLDQAMENGEPLSPNDHSLKYRMIGARSFPASPEQKQLGFSNIVSWEIRSGNKGKSREFVEDTLESRLVTGDYSGMKDFRSYQFDPSAPLQEILAPFLKAQEIQVLLQFQDEFPDMKWSSAKSALNHGRNKIVSPLLPWENRLDLSGKMKVYKRSQKKYADSLLQVASEYLAAVKNAKNTTEIGDLRDEAREKMLQAMYEFSDTVRLDLTFERYLKPRPSVIPSPIIPRHGPIDVNLVALGIEYSFRFPLEQKPDSFNKAKVKVKSLADALAADVWKTNTVTPVKSADSHGHGISIKYNVADGKGDKWRVEWDGILRSYDDDGNVEKAYGGHIEVASPKFYPFRVIDGPIEDLFKATRNLELVPKRSAGGGHMNFDLEFLKDMPDGPRKVLNLINYFENNESVMLFLWTHPQRFHAAQPVVLGNGFADATAKFNGSWTDLAKLLYDQRYFNVFEGRKPKYVPMNFASILKMALPEKYAKTGLDIKNPEQYWYPDFGNSNFRAEARFFDAPTDEVMAALQIKYWRAVMNKAFNSPAAIAFDQANENRITTDMQFIVYPDLWLQMATAHLKDLGLDPKEFEFLIWDAYFQRRNYEKYQPHHKFVPIDSASGEDDVSIYNVKTKIPA